jgi:AcrR family transcriptional regulator
MAARFPIREQRKAQTHEKLLRSAAELFASKGYEATTLEEVADNAGLHVQTLYRHFPTKQDLATAGDQALLDRFRAAIVDPGRGNTTFEFWRDWVEQAAQWVMRDGGDNYRRYLRSSAGLPAVAVRLKAILDEYEDLLTESLTREFAPCADRVSSARLVAGMLLAGNSYALRCYAREKVDLVKEVVAVTRSVEAMFAHLIVDGAVDPHR